MEFKVFKLLVIVLFVQSFSSVSSVSLRQLSERMDLLELRIENRFDYEQSRRYKDFESIMTQFSEITTRMDKWEERLSLSDVNLDKTSKPTVGSSEANDSNQPDMLKYLINGLQEEKKATRIMKREILRLGSAIHEANTRDKSDVSLIDSVLNESNSILKEQFNNLSLTLADQLESMITESKATGKAMHKDLKRSLKKLCKFDRTKTMIETTIKQLWIDMPPTSKTNGSTPSATNSCPCSETNVPSSPKKTRTEPASFKSCKDALSKGYKTDGVYKINGFDRYCDQTTDGGGWTVFQRRINGVVDFDRDWKSYKQGFGDISGEFWLGNDYLSRKRYELRIDFEDFEGNRSFAKYSRFRIDPERNNYTLHVRGYSGNATDILRYNDGYKFSTKDMELDALEGGSCAQIHSGGWWFRKAGCLVSNLNGKYYLNRGYIDGINWGGYRSINPPKFVEMKFR